MNVETFTVMDYFVLDYEQLLKINGAGGGSGSGGPTGPSNPDKPATNPSPHSTSPNTDTPSPSTSSSGKGSSRTSPSSTDKNPNKTASSDRDENTLSSTTTSTKNGIDNTNNPTIVKKFTASGYELLSDKKDTTYTAGSRKEYMQSEFENFKSNTDSFTIVKTEGRFEGVRGGVSIPYNDYDRYQVLGNDGKIYMDAIDVNRDGKIDYVK